MSVLPAASASSAPLAGSVDDPIEPALATQLDRLLSLLGASSASRHWSVADAETLRRIRSLVAASLQRGNDHRGRRPAERLLDAQTRGLEIVGSRLRPNAMLRALVAELEQVREGWQCALHVAAPAEPRVALHRDDPWTRTLHDDGGVLLGVLVADPTVSADPDDFDRSLLDCFARLATTVLTRMRAEQETEQSRELLHDGESLGQAGSWEWDVARSQVRLSAGMYRIVGLPPREGAVTVEQSLERVHREDREAVRTAMYAAAAAPGRHELRYRIVRSGGEVRTLRARLRSHADGAGRALRVVGVSQDVTEQELAVEALRRSELRYRHIFQRNPLPLLVFEDATLRILAVNDAAIQHYGWSEAEFLAMTIRDIRPPEELLTLDRALHRVLADSDPRHVQRSQARHRRKDGSIIHVDIFSHALDAEGVAARLVLMHDVTARVMAQRALAESEARFRAFVEQSTDALVVVDAGGIFEYVSPTITRMLGYAPDAVAGARLFEFLHPDDMAPTLAALGRTVEGAVVHRIEVRARHADGSWVTVEAVGHRLTLGAEDCPKILVSIRDTSERHRAEEALRASEERFRSLTASAPLGVFLIGADCDVQYANPRAQEMWGISGAAPDSFRWQSLVHPEDLPAVRAVWAEALADGRDLDHEYRVMRSDGSVRWVHELARPLRDARGAVSGAVSTVEDVSERRELESQLRQAQKMEAVGQLAGGVAHDFNNLLTVIKAHTEFLHESMGEEHGNQEDVAEIAKAASRAASLTRQLLAFSRKQLLRPQALDLNDVLAGVEAMLSRLIGEDITLAVVPASKPAPVRADPGQLEQVIVNLAVNARDAMTAGGMLSLSTACVELTQPLPHEHGVVPAGRYVVLRASDTGSGMPEHVRRRVFEPFFTTKAPGQGTGLGLSTVYGIVRQSGGHVTLSSAPGDGTTFQIFLPLVTLPARVEPRAEAPAPVATGTILLVEDEAAVRSLARRVLERRGYTVLEARHGRDAIDIALRHDGSIDLLLTDVVMPEMNGRELADTVLDLRPGIRVAFMSGYTDDVIVHRGALSPRLVLLHKPFTTHELVQAVSTALGPA